MSRKPDAQYAALRAALRFGPDVETTKFCNATGLDANDVNAALVRTRRAGRVKIVSKRFSHVRRIILTHAGHDFSSEREDVLLGKGHMKKPSAACQDEAKEARLPQMPQGVPFLVAWRARLCPVQGNRRVARAHRRPDVPSHEDKLTCTSHTKAFAIGLLTGVLLGCFGREAAAHGDASWIMENPETRVC